MLPRNLQQLLIKRSQRSHQLFALDLLIERLLLLHKAQQKETEPVH